MFTLAKYIQFIIWRSFEKFLNVQKYICIFEKRKIQTTTSVANKTINIECNYRNYKYRENIQFFPSKN